MTTMMDFVLAQKIEILIGLIVIFVLVRIIITTIKVKKDDDEESYNWAYVKLKGGQKKK